MSIKFAAGIKLGELTLLRRRRPHKGLNANCKKRWVCRCICGKEIIVPEYYFKRPKNPKQHCGCLFKTIKTLNDQEYRIWYMMHVRTEDPSHVAYKHYGGRGIKVCKEWNKATYEDDTIAFKNFLDHIGKRPSMAYSVDRINVDGNYEPGNVRWATRKEQAANKRPIKKG